MRRMCLALAAVGALLLVSCSDQEAGRPSQPTSEIAPPSESNNPAGRVVGVAYVEMSSRAVVVRESPNGALTACFWNAGPSHSSPQGCVPLE